MNDFKHIYNNGNRRIYEFVSPWHEHTERLLVELTPCTISYERGSLASHWAKRTDFDKSLTSYWHVTVEFKAVNGSLWHAYNPQTYNIPGRYVNRYEAFYEATEDNISRILDEVQDMYENNIVHYEAPADYFDRVA